MSKPCLDRRLVTCFARSHLGYRLLTCFARSCHGRCLLTCFARSCHGRCLLTCFARSCHGQTQKEYNTNNPNVDAMEWCEHRSFSMGDHHKKRPRCSANAEGNGGRKSSVVALSGSPLATVAASAPAAPSPVGRCHRKASRHGGGDQPSGRHSTGAGDYQSSCHSHGHGDQFSGPVAGGTNGGGRGRGRGPGGVQSSRCHVAGPQSSGHCDVSPRGEAERRRRSSRRASRSPPLATASYSLPRRRASRSQKSTNGPAASVSGMVWLLNDVYDAEHRAYFMSEKKMALIGMSPQEPEVEDGGKKDRVPAGATFTWIAANFAHCPEDADDEVIQRYARVYMWYVISRTIFADGTGKNAPWMWLKALTVLDNKFSWGSAALAYLYRQLDDACRRTTKDGGVGGCMLLLSVWSWERLPVRRPKSSKWNTWDDHDNPVRQPTWAYKWDLVSEVASEVNLLYKQYTNEMDSLTPEQVEWEPYGVGTNFGDAHTFELNALCVQERHLWLMRCPLICNWAVEWHLPHRVLRQFGYFQPHPPEWVDTDTQLHRLDRRRQRKIKDWQKHHKSYVLINYLRWFQESTRVEICPPAYEEDILEEPTEYDELAQGGYSKLIREGYQTSFAPVLNFVRKEVKKQANESEDILDNTPGGKKGESALRLFIKEQGKKLRRLSNILGCRDPEYVSPSRSGSSERNTLDDSASSGARMDDGDITQRNTQEDDVDTPQAADDMTLKAFQRSAYMLKPRKEFKPYSPDDYAKGKNPVAGSSRLSRMRSREDEVEDDDDDESDDPDQFVVARRKKLVSKRGRGPK
ncbi:mutator protein [Hordeum vulgare]|nr:mutator protein [Hordeum vulgare]